MPRLLIFLACEKAFVSEAEKTQTIVAVLEEVTAESKEALPLDAVLPMKWVITSTWLKEEKDQDKGWEQQVEVVAPDKSIVQSLTFPFEFPNTITRHRSIYNVIGFPGGHPGTLELRLSFKHNTEQKWKQVANYPINVVHKSIVEEKISRPEGTKSRKQKSTKSRKK